MSAPCIPDLWNGYRDERTWKDFHYEFRLKTFCYDGQPEKLKIELLRCFHRQLTKEIEVRGFNLFEKSYAEICADQAVLHNGSKISEDKALQLLSSIRLAPNSSADEYHAKIKTLMVEANVSEDFALRKFIHGLPENVRIAFFITSPRPDTLQKAAVLAGQVIDGFREYPTEPPSFVGAIGGRPFKRSPKEPSEHSQYATPKHGRNASRPAHGASSSSASWSTARPPTGRAKRDPGPKTDSDCTFCGKPGHLEKYCFSRIDGLAPTKPLKKPIKVRAIGLTQLTLDVSLFGTRSTILADSGAEYSFIHSSVLPEGVKLTPCYIRASTANASVITLEGSIRANLTVLTGGLNLTREINFLVSNELDTDMILGLSDMGLFGILMDTETKTVIFKSLTSTPRSSSTLLATTRISVTDNSAPADSRHPAPSVVEISLSPRTIEMFEATKKQFPLLWSSDSNSSRRSTLPPLKLQLKPEHPSTIRSHSRPLNPRDREFVSKQVSEWKASGIVEPSTCKAFRSPLLVAWRNGKPRLCVNSIALNAMTVFQPHTPPRVETIRMIVGDASEFSVIDVKRAFLAISLDPESRDYTTFADPDGNLLRFTCMSFGLMDSPGHYQSCLEDLLSGIQGINIYIDDILLFTDSVDAMTKLLATVLQRLDGAKLLINSEKSRFFLSTVPYLGNVLSRSSIRPDPLRVESISKQPFPASTTDLKSFFGAVEIVCPFIQDFGLVKGLLLPLLRKTVPYLPTRTQHTAFIRLKQMVSTAVLLYNPDMSRPVVLRTDASTIGLGAVLYQLDDDGAIRPIQFLSRALQPGAERNYGSQKLEMLAVKWSLQVLENWLLGHPDLTVITDHQSLVWCFSDSQENATIRRWAAEISRFQPKFEYRSGESNVVADFLSRHPTLVEAFQPHSNDDEEVGGVTFPSDIGATSVPIIAQSSSLLAIQAPRVVPTWLNPVQLRALQEEDRFCVQVADASDEGCRRLVARLKVVSFDVDSASGVLLATIPDLKSTRRVIVAPNRITSEVIDHFHGKGHFHYFKVMKSVRREFFWPTLHDDIRSRLADCIDCSQRDKAIRHPTPGGLLSATRPNELVATDIMGPCPLTASDNQYIITFIDVFTKFAVAVALPDSKATTIARAFRDNWISIFDAPEAVLSDNGSQYKSTLFETVLEALNIKHRSTTAYHPSGNGMAERLNRTLQGSIAKLTTDVVAWDSFLTQACLAHNSTISSATGFSPFVAMLGRDPPALVKLPSALGPSEQFTQSAQDQASTTSIIAAQFDERLSRQDLNNSVLAPFGGLKIGDVVLLENPVYPQGQGQKKFFRPYARAPFRITELHHPNNATIVPHGPSDGKTQRVNTSRIKLAVPSLQVPNSSPAAPSLPVPTPLESSPLAAPTTPPVRFTRTGRATRAPARFL